MGLGFVIGQRAALRQFSSDIGAEYIKGGFLPGNDRVIAKVKQWTVTIDTCDESLYSTTRTRMRASYVRKDEFRFTIYPERGIAKLDTALRTQDIKFGDLMFDDVFVIKASDESKVRALLENRRTRSLIQGFPSIHLESKNDAHSPINVLLVEVEAITAVERIKSLFNLVGEILNQLCRIGSASEDDPNLVVSK